MSSQWTAITTVHELESAIDGTTEQPVVVFQHDPACPISRYAYHHMSHVNHPIVMVDVSRDSVVKRAIAQRTGIRHESPQVIVFRHGEALWSASHGAITQQAVEQALTDQSVRDEQNAAER